jgi:hypothetical protein
VGTFATLLRGSNENVRGKERELGPESSSGIVCCSKYTVRYLNMLVHSAYTLVGQSANIPKSCSHCMSHVHAFLVARHTRGSRGVPRRLNCLLS